MKSKNAFWILVILSASLLMSTNSIIPVSPSVWDPPTNPPWGGTYEKYGPRVTDVIFEMFAGDLGLECEALRAGEIDFMDWPTTVDRIPAWKLDTGDGAGIWMGDVEGLWYYEFDLNLQNWPMGDGLGESTSTLKHPTPNGEGDYWINYTRQRARDCRDFRRALAMLFNRPSLLSYMKGYGVTLDTFIPPVIDGWEAWANGTKFKDYAIPPPTYSYDPFQANLTLWNAGFRDYDDDGDIDYSKSKLAADREDLPPLQLWIRSDDPVRSKAGQDLWDELLSLGIPVSGAIASKSECFDHAWVKYDYHIYTGGWDIGREPDYYYDLWHSSQDNFPRPGANNYMRYHNKDYDPYGEALKYAQTTEEAREALYHCEYMVADEVAGIPTHTDIGYVASRKQYGSFGGDEANYAGEDWLGLQNEKGVSFFSWFTLLNSHPGIFEKGGVLRHGMLNDVESFNPIHAEWFWDGLAINTIYDYLVTGNPYDLSEYMPWLCNDYTIDRWYNTSSATWGSYVNLDLLDNVLWHHTTRHFNATDVKVTFELMKKCQSVLWYPYVEKLDHITIHSEFNVTIYYSVESCWVESWLSAFPMMPAYIWGEGGYYNADPDLIWAATPETEGTLIGTGPFMYVDRVTGVYIHVEENPYYFRKLIWPDVYDPADGSPGSRDEIVGLMDFLKCCLPGFQFTDENPDGTWPAPVGVWGAYCDVNYDGTINTGDLTEIGIHYKAGLPSWPPEYYK